MFDKYENPFQRDMDRVRNSDIGGDERFSIVFDIMGRAMESGTRGGMMSPLTMGGLYALGELSCDRNLDETLRSRAIFGLGELAATNTRGCAHSAMDDYLQYIAKDPEATALQSRVIKSLRAIWETHSDQRYTIEDIAVTISQREDVRGDKEYEYEAELLSRTMNIPRRPQAMPAGTVPS